jgi:hypothetical protein
MNKMHPKKLLKTLCQKLESSRQSTVAKGHDADALQMHCKSLAVGWDTFKAFFRQFLKVASK